MTSILAHAFHPTDYSSSTMVKVMKEVDPMDYNARDHYHRRMIEAMEKRKVIDDEIEAIKMVIIEDDEKRASKFHGCDSLSWESLHATNADAVTSAPQSCKTFNKRVKIGTIVKVTTGKYAGHTGMVVSRWNKSRPQIAKQTTWNVLLFSNNKVIRRMQKTLVMDIESGF
jgi:KOW motif